jgi:hypothetical protein
MPGEEIGAGLEAWGWGHPNLLPVERPILLAIIEFLLDTVAYLEMMIRGDRHISGIEQSVNVRSKEKTIVNAMWPLFTEGLDVGGFQRWRSPLPRNGASPFINIRYKNSKTPLP